MGVEVGFGVVAERRSERRGCDGCRLRCRGMLGSRWGVDVWTCGREKVCVSENRER